MMESILEDQKLISLKRGLSVLARLVDDLQTFVSSKNINEVSRTIDMIRSQNFYLGSVINPSIEHKIFDSEQISELVKDREIALYLAKSKLGQELIVAWLKTFDNLADEAFFENKELVKIFIDRKLPSSWSFSRALIILSSSYAPEIIQNLILRGQKRFVITGDAAQPASFKSLQNTEFVHAETHDDFLDFLIGFGNQYAQTVCLLDPSNATDEFSLSLVTQGQEILQDIALGLRTAKRFREGWIENKLKNMVKQREFLDQSFLPEIFTDRDVIIVSPGPSLKDDLSVLKKCQDNFLILAVAQAIPALTSAKIAPDFLMVVDSNDYSHVISEFSVKNAGGLIAVEQVNQNFLKHNFKHKIILYDNGDVTPIRKWRNLEAYNHDGGSVSVSAFKLAVRFNARTVALLGQDLVLTSGQYFVGDQDFSKIVRKKGRSFFPPEKPPELENDGKFISIGDERKPAFYLRGLDGNQHVTKGDYFFFHRQLVYSAKDILRHNKTVSLVNCTSSGAFIDGFDHISLTKHCENIVSAKTQLSPEVKQEIIINRLTNVSKNNDDVSLWLKELKTALEMLRSAGKDLRNLLKDLDVNDKRWSTYFNTLKTVSDNYPVVNAISGDTTNALNKRISVIKDNNVLLYELELFLKEMQHHCDYLLSISINATE